MASEISTITYTLIAIVISLLFLPLFFESQPDISPYALIQQASVSPTRRKKESPIYRSRDTPHGFPLRQGLDIRKGNQLRPGDIRDIWNAFLQKPGQLHTILGDDKVVHSVDTLNREIDTLGYYINKLPVDAARKVVAAYLPNSAEALLVGFVCAFYDYTFVPIKYSLPAEEVKELLQQTKAEILILEAATLSLATLHAETNLKHAIVVVEEGSRHMDFASSPHDQISINAWHEIAANSDLGTRPEKIDETQPAVLVYTRNLKTNQKEVFSYTHRNIVSAVAAQITALPPREQFTARDVFVPANTLADQFTRIITYVAMVCGSTVIVNAVVPPKGKIEACCELAKPTVIAISAEALVEIHKISMASQVELFHEWKHWFNVRTMKKSGVIPTNNWWARFNDYDRPNLGKQLRLMYVSENPSDGMMYLAASMLNNLRAIFYAKVVYTLVYPPAAAGAIAQQHVHDYRPSEKPDEKGNTVAAHFGPPLSCLEIKTRDAGKFSFENPDGSSGELVVSGPAAVGGIEQGTGLIGKFREDGCLELVQG